MAQGKTSRNTPAPRIAVLVLAAGASRRMNGPDKLLQPVGGVPLLRRQASAALATGAQVVVTLPPGNPARRAALDGLAVQMVMVDDATEGMAASIRAGVRALPADIAAVIILPADMPDLGTEDLIRFIDGFSADPTALILRAVTPEGRPGHPVLFARPLFGALTDLTGDTGARPVLAAHAESIRTIPLPGLRAVTDLDTPQDWAEWRRRSGQTG